MLFQKHKIFLLFKNFFSAFSFFLIIYSASGQHTESAVQDVLRQVSGSITTDDLYRHIALLSADSMEGRETGKPGQKKAAAYIQEQFRQYGLKPVPLDGMETYAQVFSLPNPKQSIISLTANGENYAHLSGFIHRGRFETHIDDTIKVSFAGYGSPEIIKEVQSGTEAIMFLHSEMNIQDRINAAFDHGYAYIFIVWESSDGFNQLVSEYRNSRGGNVAFLGDRRKRGHIFLVSPELAFSITGTPVEKLQKAAEQSLGRSGKTHKKQRMVSLVIHADPQDSLIHTENILGFIEGKVLPEECLVITAHYDHVGTRGGEIYNGADDNASGTAALMELAEGFSIAAQNDLLPYRSVLFIAFTGEEKGLLGSRYYVDHPVFPLTETVVNLNIDMIGRSDVQHGKDSSYVYLIGSDKLSDELHEISERNNREYTGLVLDYTYNRDEDPNRFYYRSDHYSFAKNNIPVIFYFTGVHEDYHKPTDTVDKIRLDKMAEITRLIFHTAWEIANREERLKLR
jgi:hypothetical protein